MLQIDVPCCHRIKLGARFQQWKKWVVEYKELPIEAENPNNSEAEFDKTYTVEQIKRYSHYKDVEKIRQYIDENYSIVNAKGSLNKKHVSVIQIITEGSTYFTNLKKKN